MRPVNWTLSEMVVPPGVAHLLRPPFGTRIAEDNSIVYAGEELFSGALFPLGLPGKQPRSRLMVVLRRIELKLGISVLPGNQSIALL